MKTRTNVRAALAAAIAIASGAGALAACACPQGSWVVEKVVHLDGGFDGSPDAACAEHCDAGVCAFENRDGGRALVCRRGPPPGSGGECVYDQPSGRRPAGLARRRAAGARVAGRFFASIAYLEAASVHAFDRLTRELASHGAPRRLAARAVAARADEVRHARAMRALASQLGGRTKSVHVAPIRARSLFALARENAIEGCVRETYGAAAAAWQATHATDERVRRAMKRIAADEARHAQLSWDIDAWARGRLSPSQRARLDAAVGRAVRALAREVARPLPRELTHEAGAPPPARAADMVAALERTLWGCAS
jgi:hypothetical protein